MSMTVEKVAEVLALPDQDRAFLAHQLIASLDATVDANAETQWQEVIGMAIMVIVLVWRPYGLMGKKFFG